MNLAVERVTAKDNLKKSSDELSLNFIKIIVNLMIFNLLTMTIFGTGRRNKIGF